jgi:hypothetical protein
MSPSVKKKLRCSFFKNMIINPEGLNYHISLDFNAPLTAAGAAMSQSVKAERFSHFFCVNYLKAKNEMQIMLKKYTKRSAIYWSKY